MGKTRDLFKKIRDTKGTLHAKMGSIKDRNGRDLTEAEDITKFSSVQFSRSVISDSLRPLGLQHTRPPCPSPTPGVYSNSCPLSQWRHPAISSSVVPFSSCLPSFPASGSFLMSQFFASGGQIIGVSASKALLNPQNKVLYAGPAT